ncbi:hypothetical protein QBC37DRAFT_187305 [Rhypophila decipiens]|uniref:Uncharacterized protein n=1 Tax=Rhypophila decipiens TaxID=261697 RepID=A0AAN6Y572_9PEZI|nr:hypothetical protein QBC37DRAFT_187305 [Rhypophila decipiens]
MAINVKEMRRCKAINQPEVRRKMLCYQLRLSSIPLLAATISPHFLVLFACCLVLHRLDRTRSMPTQHQKTLMQKTMGSLFILWPLLFPSGTACSYLVASY